MSLLTIAFIKIVLVYFVLAFLLFSLFGGAAKNTIALLHSIFDTHTSRILFTIQISHVLIPIGSFNSRQPIMVIFSWLGEHNPEPGVMM